MLVIDSYSITVDNDDNHCEVLVARQHKVDTQDDTLREY